TGLCLPARESHVLHSCQAFNVLMLALRNRPIQSFATAECGFQPCFDAPTVKVPPYRNGARPSTSCLPDRPRPLAPVGPQVQRARAATSVSERTLAARALNLWTHRCD